MMRAELNRTTQSTLPQERIMKFYLGGPINGCTDQEAHGWREEAKTLLSSLGHTYKDPMDRDYRGREMEPGIAAAIVNGDKADIRACDILLMNAPQPSWGTAMEIFYGHSLGKKVYVVLPADGRAPSPWVVFASARIFRGSVLAAIRTIAGIPEK
jgi:nucleoside 2-deoxyribosyltransferase